MTNKKILILEDHHVVRLGLRFLLNESFTSYQVYDVDNSEAAIRLLRETKDFDLLITDLRIPAMEPTAFIKNIVAEFPDIKIIILSAMAPDVYAKYYYSIGVKSFLNKSDISNSEIKKAVDIVLNNKVYIPESLSLALNLRLFKSEIEFKKNPFDNLSQKELSVLDLLLKGDSVSKIAELLNNHPSTIGTFKTRIYGKLGVRNLIELKNMHDLYYANPAIIDSVIG